MAKALGVTTDYLVIVCDDALDSRATRTRLDAGNGGAGAGVGSAALLLVKRAGQKGFTTVFGRNDDA